MESFHIFSPSPQVRWAGHGEIEPVPTKDTVTLEARCTVTRCYKMLQITRCFHAFRNQFGIFVGGDPWCQTVCSMRSSSSVDLRIDFDCFHCFHCFHFFDLNSFLPGSSWHWCLKMQARGERARDWAAASGDGEGEGATRRPWSLCILWSKSCRLKPHSRKQEGSKLSKARYCQRILKLKTELQDLHGYSENHTSTSNSHQDFWTIDAARRCKMRHC